MKNNTSVQSRSDIASNDYLKQMFEEGGNRTAGKSAPAYDEAAHTVSADEEEDAQLLSPSAPSEAASSRDGTESAGLYHEEGGPIGGTEDELDSLEAGGTPVDRAPHMKD